MAVANTYELPPYVYEELSIEQQALIHLLDDPDEEVFDNVAERLAKEGDKMCRVIEMVYDYGAVKQDKAITSRSQYILRRHRELEIIDLLEKGELDLDTMIQILLYIDEIILLKQIDHEFVIEELEGMKKQAWLNSNYYMSSEVQIATLNTVFYHFLNFRYIGEDADFKSYTFIESLYNRRAGQYVLFLYYFLLVRSINLPIEAYSLEGLHFMGYLNEDNDLPKIAFFIDPTAGLIYSRSEAESILQDMDMAPDLDDFVALGHKDIIREYINTMVQRCPEEDNDLLLFLNRLMKYFI